MESINERDFKGIWIPKEIWTDKNLTIMEKVFLVEIDSLDNSSGCYASNKYFSDFFEISKGRCTQIIKELETKGYIKIKLERDGKQITRRVIRVVNKLNRVVSKLNRGSEKTKQGYLENDEENNTSLNSPSSSNTSDRFNYSNVIEIYHRTCPELSKIRELTSNRQKTLKAWGNLEEMTEVFEIVSGSRFLNGDNDRKWKADFDWIIKPANRVKILEGKYSNGEPVKPTTFLNFQED